MGLETREGAGRAAASQVWPEAAEQRRWNHKIVNVLDRLPKREQGEGRQLLRSVAYAPTRVKAEATKKAFEKRFGPWYPKAVEVLGDDWGRMVTFYDFSEPHWNHLRTTNVIESPFASVRLSDLGGQAIQASRQRNNPDPVALTRSRAPVPKAERSPPAQGCV